MDNQVENFLNIIKYAIHADSSEELPELHEPVDWVALDKFAKAHNLFPLFHEVAYKYPEYKKQPNYAQNVNITLTTVAQQIRKTETFLELYRAFLKEDLHPIVMKGIICRQLYGKYAEHRPSGDEDILVRKEDFYKVRAVMEERGYECEFKDVTEAQLEQLQEVGFYENGSRFLIEVHTNIMGHENKMRTQMGECFRDVFEHVRTIEVRDVPITTMSHTEHFLFLVLHAVRHFVANGVGVRQMLDILLYQESFEQEIDWKWVKTTLKKNHADGYLGDLQSIGVKYLGFDLKMQFEACNPENLLADMMEAGVFGNRGEADGLAGRINLGTIDQKKTGIGTWIRMIFPTVKFMVNAAPYLVEKPWLLPVEWVKRWGRFLKRAKKYNGNLIADSVKKSQERMELLKKYGLRGDGWD